MTSTSDSQLVTAAEAARILGITRKNLWEKMREYGIDA